MSRASHKAELGATMGVAQMFAGVSRVSAPLIATAAFQQIGPESPFLLAAGIVALVSVMAFRVDALPMHTGETPVPTQRT
jgi:NADH:ubiquinone oxidoreductase subunit 2 (subunit N)